MNELERALAALGEELALPAAPDVSAAVLARIAEPAPRRLPLRRRRPLLLAFVALLVALGAALAVPAARTAILDFFGLQGATVRRVETLPEASGERIRLPLGTPVPVRDGIVQAKWAPFVVPEALGAPDRAFYSPVPTGGKISLVYEPGPGIPRSEHTGVGLLVTEFRGDLDPGYIDKLADAGTAVEPLTILGSPALWLEGGPHFVFFRTRGGTFVEEPGRLAGNTLLVEHGPLLVRIEGEIDRARAVVIAESLRRP